MRFLESWTKLTHNDIERILNYQEIAEFLKGRESIMTYEKEADEAKQIVKRLKKLNLKGHIDFLEHYLKAMPIMYDKAKLEVILWDWKELQKILGEKND